MNDIPVANVDTSGSTSTVAYVTADQLGTPRAIANSNSTTEWQLAYQGNPFEEVQPISSGYTYNFRSSGEYYDVETGLNDNIFRPRNTAIWRFTQSDPTGLLGGISTYAAVGNNPLSYIDPLGLNWHYSQATGQVTDDNGNVVGQGYAGHGQGVNNPAMQNVSMTGPLPQGTYTIGPQQDNRTSNNTDLTASMRLTPSASNQMFGRSGFLLHGPHANDHMDSSDGCPVLNRAIRNRIGQSNDHILEVDP